MVSLATLVEDMTLFRTHEKCSCVIPVPSYCALQSLAGYEDPSHLITSSLDGASREARVAENRPEHFHSHKDGSRPLHKIMSTSATTAR